MHLSVKYGSEINAIDYFSDKGELYKAEIIKDFPKDEEVSIYKQGEWLDLCRGPHLPTTKHIGKSFQINESSWSLLAW